MKLAGKVEQNLAMVKRIHCSQCSVLLHCLYNEEDKNYQFMAVGGINIRNSRRASPRRICKGDFLHAFEFDGLF